MTAGRAPPIDGSARGVKTHALMDRNELEGLDRDTLIARAEETGITRARILTRPELIDELLVKTMKAAASERDLQRARGLFGRARDLIARVVERGLHLPDAADRLRGKSAPPPPLRSTAAPLPTVIPRSVAALTSMLLKPTA